MKLRAYQESDLQGLRKTIAKGSKRPLFVAPCGYGKTALCFEITKNAVKRGKTVLFLAHRRLLIEQTYKKFKEYGIKPSILMSGHEFKPSPVVLATKQTYGRRLLLEDVMFNKFFVNADIVVTDEAHFSVSPSYKKIFKLYPSSLLIGLTATPARTDQRGLGEVYDCISEGTSIKDLIDQGFLVPIRYFAGKSPNMEGVKIDYHTGDYNAKEATKRATPLIGDVVENWLKLGENRPTICFATGIKHSIYLRDKFRKYGIKAEHMDANTPHEERSIIIKKLEYGDINIITNCQLLTEGIDIPIVSCIVMARPTNSIPLYHQMVGRGMRPHPDKPNNCLLLDHGGNIERHGFIEDKIKWSLDGNKKAWVKVKKYAKDKKPKQCKVCGLIFEKGIKCPDCGSEFKPFGKKIETIKADLKEVKRKTKDLPTGIKRATYAGLLYIAHNKNYKVGWCDYMYKIIFKTWPNKINKRTILPAKAEGKALNLIRYGYIKKAKSKRR